MRRDIVYGVYDERMEYGKFVEVFVGVEQERYLGIRWKKDGRVEVFHFLIRDLEDYRDFVDELKVVLRDCEDIGAAYLALEVYLESEYADDWLEEYDGGDNN